MKNSSVLLLVLVCGVFTAFAANSLIGYTTGVGVGVRVRETAEEEFDRRQSKFLRIHDRVVETAQEEFDPSESESLRYGERVAGRDPTDQFAR